MKPVSQKTAVGRTHLERRREAEQRILGAALSIVAQRGLEALTLQEAGEAAGFSRALPAHYFGTREAMMAAVVEQVITDYHQRLDASEYGRLDGLAALMSSVTFLVSEARRAPLGLQAFYEVSDAAARRPSVSAVVARVQGAILDGAVANLQVAIDRGEVRADLHPRLEAVLFISSLRGLMSRWLSDPDAFVLEDARDAFIAGLRRNWAPD